MSAPGVTRARGPITIWRGPRRCDKLIRMVDFAFKPNTYVPDDPENMLSNYSFHVTDKSTGKTTHHASESHFIKSYPDIDHEDVGADLEHHGMTQAVAASRGKGKHKDVATTLKAETDRYKVEARELSGVDKGRAN